jgi:membrane associated rhomboid family serine protease
VSKVASVSGAFPRAAGLLTFIWLLMASDMSFLVLGSVEPEKHLGGPVLNLGIVCRSEIQDGHHDST